MKSRDYRIKKLKDSGLAALLMAGAAFTACSGSEDIATGEPAQTASSKYTMTVKASKDAASTRGLTLDGNTIGVKWYADEEVKVIQNNQVIGTLTPIAASDNGTVTLTGELDSEPTTDPLYFYLHQYGEDYSGQNGVLLASENATKSIEKNYDFAHTFVLNDKFTVNGKQVIVPDGITLSSDQAIVRFTLVKDDGNGGTSALSATSLKIEESGSSHIISGPLTIIPDGATSVLYVAIRGINTNERKCNLKLTATVGNDIYTYSKSDVVFEHSKFYPITVKMSKVVDLSTLSARYTAQNGDILTGTLGGAYAVSIADGASVTLKDVDINSNGAYFANYDGIGCAGDATITLEGTNKVRALGSRQSGIGVGNNKTLTIQGSGSLEVWGSGMGAGIGGNIDGTCGNITIKSGTITARGGTNKASAGIGGGSGHYCGVITISGGDVTAIGGAGGAGIGSADGAVSCDGISISSGTVNATGSNGAAGIGCGSNSNCGDISISGGTITATGGIYAAGIGGSAGEKSVGICGKITITGGKITATGGDASAGIGGGWGCGDITISGAKINSTKGYYAPNSIGKCSAGVGGTVTIDGTLYWDGSTYTNGGYDYLTQSPLKINWDN